MSFVLGIRSTTVAETFRENSGEVQVPRLTVTTKHTLAKEIVAVLSFYRDVVERVDEQPIAKPPTASGQQAIRSDDAVSRAPQPDPNI